MCSMVGLDWRRAVMCERTTKRSRLLQLESSCEKREFSLDICHESYRDYARYFKLELTSLLTRLLSISPLV